MSKLASTLILFGAAACMWQQSEAKPFFFLKVPTLSVPTTDIRASTSVTSSFPTSNSYGGNFQLPAAIIAKKINFITSLLASLGGGGGCGAGGNIGGGIGGACGFGVGVNINGATSTSRPSTTAEPDAVFQIDTSSSTTAPTTTTTTAAPTTTTTTEEPVVVEEVEPITITVEKVVEAAAPIVTTTTTATAAPIITTTTTVAAPIIVADSVTESDITTAKTTTILPVTTEPTINIEPTVFPQNPAIIKSTTNSDLDDGAIYSFTGNINAGRGRPQTVGAVIRHENGAISGPNSAFNTVIQPGYQYQPIFGQVAQPHFAIENEILGGSVRNSYLPGVYVTEQRRV